MSRDQLATLQTSSFEEVQENNQIILSTLRQPQQELRKNSLLYVMRKSESQQQIQQEMSYRYDDLLLKNIQKKPTIPHKGLEKNNKLIASRVLASHRSSAASIMRPNSHDKPLILNKRSQWRPNHALPILGSQVNINKEFPQKPNKMRQTIGNLSKLNFKLIPSKIDMGKTQRSLSVKNNLLFQKTITGFGQLNADISTAKDHSEKMLTTTLDLQSSLQQTNHTGASTIREAHIISMLQPPQVQKVIMSNKKLPYLERIQKKKEQRDEMLQNQRALELSRQQLKLVTAK